VSVVAEEGFISLEFLFVNIFYYSTSRAEEHLMNEEIHFLMNSSFVFTILKIIDKVSLFYILLPMAQTYRLILFIMSPLQNFVLELVF
jgi:hypothetical protein